jgi:hypothetical protein
MPLLCSHCIALLLSLVIPEELLAFCFGIQKTFKKYFFCCSLGTKMGSINVIIWPQNHFFVTPTAKLYLVGQTIGYMKMSWFDPKNMPFLVIKVSVSLDLRLVRTISTKLICFSCKCMSSYTILLSFFKSYSISLSIKSNFMANDGGWLVSFISYYPDLPGQKNLSSPALHLVT